MKDINEKYKCLCKFVKELLKSFYNFGANPVRDWKILLVIFFVFFILTIFFSYRFLWISSGNSFSLSDEIVPSKIEDLNISDLNLVIKHFDEKQKRFDGVKSSWKSNLDPSI